MKPPKVLYVTHNSRDLGVGNLNLPKTYSRVHIASPNREGQYDDPVGSHNCALMMFMMRKNDELHVPDG